LQGCDSQSMPQPSSTISLAHAATQQPLAIQHHAQEAQATTTLWDASASTWVRFAAANRAAATLRAGTENLPPAGVEELAQPACKAAKHSHADTPHCAEQRSQPPAALQGSTETLPQREGPLASATDCGNESTSHADSDSASEASHGTYRWSNASNSDNADPLPASDDTEDESLGSGGSPSASSATCTRSAAVWCPVNALCMSQECVSYTECINCKPGLACSNINPVTNHQCLRQPCSMPSSQSCSMYRSPRAALVTADIASVAL